MWLRLERAVIAVSDLEAAQEAYRRLLGRPAAQGPVETSDGYDVSRFELGNAGLELRAARGGTPEAAALRAHVAQRGEGLAGLVLATPDVARCRAALRRRGVDGALHEVRERPSQGDPTRSFPCLHLATDATRGIPVCAESPRQLHVPAAADEAAAVSGLDHVVIHSEDLPASRAVWGERLGLRLALDRAFEARGLRILFFRLAGVTVEVVGALAPTGEPDPRDRFYGLAHQVPDVEAARERVCAEGFDVSEVRSGHKPGTAVCTVRSGTRGVPTLLIGS
jgi:catechol 2,3-dioxygenase-like lactoylglutathione lyase family enzyme